MSIDDLDRADELTVMERDTSIAAVQRAAERLSVPSGAEHCAVCGVAIAEGRRRAVPAARRCVDCATESQP